MHICVSVTNSQFDSVTSSNVMRGILFISMCVIFNTGNVYGMRISKDLISDLNSLQDEFAELLDEFREKQPENDNAEHEKTVTDEIAEINSRITDREGIVFEEKGSDILVAPPENDVNQDNMKRNAIGTDTHLWTTRDIAYAFDSKLSAKKRKVIQDAMETISNVSCIKFHAKTKEDKNHLKFIYGGGCYSYVGRYSEVNENGQQVSIGPGCDKKGIVMHELLHALGFYHEQSRSDRDQYIEIFWENIIPSYLRNFVKKDARRSRNLNSPYDLESIMHYSSYAFTKDIHKKTLQAIKDPNKKLGQREKLSDVDIQTLKQLYRCGDGKTSGWVEWSEWVPCHIERKKCVQKRYRYCIDGKDKCVGKVKESQDCKMDMCKQDGHWGRWSSWSGCVATEDCVKGKHTRKRKCNNPKPFQGGEDCEGEKEDYKECLGACPKKCTFEDDANCGYEKTGEWKRKKGATATQSTGPSSDANGDAAGYYLSTEARFSYPGTLSQLSSPRFSTSTSPRCYSFQYHMYGAAIGSLKLYIDDGKSLKRRVLIWKKRGNQKNEWHKVEIDIEKNTKFQMTFDAMQGSGTRGDIFCLDNLFLTDGACDNPTPRLSSDTTDYTSLEH